MAARKKRSLDPKKILRRARFHPRDAYREALDTRLGEIKEQIRDQNIEKPAEQLPISKIWRVRNGLLASFIIIVLALTMFSCSRSAWLSIINWVKGVSLFTIEENQWDTTVVTAAPEDGSSDDLLTLEEAQDLVPFKIVVPNKLPEDLILYGLVVNDVEGKEPGWRVAQLYIPAGGSDVVLMITQSQGEDEAGALVSDQALQKTNIFQHDAFYVLGAWDTNNSGEILWNESLDVVMLFWSDGQFSYSVNTRQHKYPIETVLVIAESMMEQ